MPALGAGIHAFGTAPKAWMAGPKSGHDVAGANLRGVIPTTPYSTGAASSRTTTPFSASLGGA
jgi:hypothetical protein